MSARQQAANVTTRVGDLAGLDHLDHETVALFISTDGRPLRGVAGFVDWRVNGALSRLLLNGTFKGDREEVLLAPTRGRLGDRRFFLFGLGPSHDASRESLRKVCSVALRVCQAAGAGKIAFAAPHGLENAFVNATADVAQGRVDVVLVGPETE
ncbi:MAG: M17 family peptidase N-terminal domain-containing protein [Myxococcota bacterium]